jgi:lysophospholipase
MAIPTGLDYQLRTRDRALNLRIHRDPHCHHVMTPRAWRETVAALTSLKSDRDRLRVPLLVLLAGNDYLVSTAAAREFVRGLAGDVTVSELDGMYHDLFHEPDRERTFAAIEPWLSRILGD